MMLFYYDIQICLRCCINRPHYGTMVYQNGTEITGHWNSDGKIITKEDESQADVNYYNRMIEGRRVQREIVTIKLFELKMKFLPPVTVFRQEASQYLNEMQLHLLETATSDLIEAMKQGRFRSESLYSGMDELPIPVVPSNLIEVELRYEGGISPATYKGQMLNGKKHGAGKMTFLNGNEYDGEWKNDLHHGNF